MLSLETPIEQLHFVGPSKAAALERLQIFTIEDLLYHVPHRYNDYSLVTPIVAAKPGETVTIKAVIQHLKTFRTKTGKQIIQATLTDETGKIRANWFNQTYLLRVLQEGDEVSFSGAIHWFGSSIVLSNPQFEIISSKREGDTLHTGRIVAVYPETEGITSKWLRNRIHEVLREVDSLIHDELPPDILYKEQLLSLKEAMLAVHFPETLAQAQEGKKRLGFDELLFFQTRSKLQKKEWEETKKAHALTSSDSDLSSFYDHIPFILTQDQQNAMNAIRQDIEKKIPMNRLLIGDVGSGKTIVAAFAMYLSYVSGYSSLLMAPTQILAEQHFRTISQLLKPLGITVDLMTGSTKTLSQETIDIPQLFNSATQRIIVGTHALLSSKYDLGTVGLVVIDEQHRFGVKQRGILTEEQENGRMPHLLTMTATPIPRTLAKTLFGNVLLSFLNTMPNGRQKVKTWLVSNEKRKKGYDWIRSQITEQEGQVFIICPLIESSESMVTVKAVTEEFEQLKAIYPEFSIGLLHGRMKGQEKTSVLEQFRDKKHQILLATPVVEVGIDIPNATVIVIEAAERFGLGQLHQLRGRVGRGNKQSYCLLFTEAQETPQIERLKAMETIHNGPQLAELDLALRGPGDIFGTRQHGIPVLKVARLSDNALLEASGRVAETLLSIDPELVRFPILREKLKKATIEDNQMND